MISRIPAPLIYGMFGLAAVGATYPVWRSWVFGSTFTLDQLLQIRCF
jgi:hypothetical protein